MFSYFDKNRRAIEARDDINRIFNRSNLPENLSNSFDVKTQGCQLKVEFILEKDENKSDAAFKAVKDKLIAHCRRNSLDLQATIRFDKETRVLDLELVEEAAILRFRRGKFVTNLQRARIFAKKVVATIKEYTESEDVDRDLDEAFAIKDSDEGEQILSTEKSKNPDATHTYGHGILREKTIYPVCKIDLGI